MHILNDSSALKANKKSFTLNWAVILLSFHHRNYFEYIYEPAPNYALLNISTKKDHYISLFVILPLGIKVVYQQAGFSSYWHGHLSQDGLVPRLLSQGIGLHNIY